MESHCTMLIVLTFSLVAMFEKRAVAYGQECIAPPPCKCTANKLYCEERHLTEVPVLAAGQEFSDLNFVENEIQSIADDSFAGLRPPNNTMMIFLSSNHLSSISPAAFRGLENVSVDLQLLYNNLTALPKALMHLEHIRKLVIGRVTSFDPEVMTVIGKSLEVLDIGFVGTWPEELNLATQLQELGLTNSNIDTLPIANKTPIFRTLRSFHLFDSVVNETLDIICHMPVLERFEVSFVQSPPGIPVLVPCANSIESVETINVLKSSFSNFSDILRSFPSSRIITVRLTRLTKLILPTFNRIEILDLYFNELENLPTTDGQSLRLTTMSMDYNLVQVIRAHDLTPFPNLKVLVLSNNPINRIESGAFLHNSALSIVDLHSTRIQCSCAMKWTGPWYNKEIVRGMCANKPMSFAEFIKTELRKCQSPVVIG